jgi:Tol biopolymer transport system component
MVYHDAKGILYITSASSVLRYQLATGSFLTPYTFSQGNLTGIDLSPDGNTLAVADKNISGIHLVDLQADALKPDVLFTPASGETGTYSVAFGGDGALLVTSGYNGSGTVPLRRIDPATGAVSVIKNQINQNSMLSGSADGKCIAFVESNSSNGPVNLYDVATQGVTKTAYTNWFNYEVGSNRDCSQFAVPTYGGTYVYDKTLAKLGSIGVYAGGQPIGAAYHPASDIVYFAWSGSSEVRAYDAMSFAQLAAFNVGYTFQNSGTAYGQGRVKLSRDGSLLFVTVANGISCQRSSLSPLAIAQSRALNGAAATAITLTGSSPRALPLSYTVLTPPVHGTLLGTAPNLSYTPDPSYSGPDSFSFKVSDGALDSTPATVSLTIDRTAPGIASFAMPPLASRLSVNVLSFSATDDVGVSGYCLLESPDPAGCTWSAVPPVSYLLGGLGSHTLYAFARDAAGNVSPPASATVSVPEIVPQITSFRIPASYGYHNLTVPVTLAASDDLGVTGFCLTESASPAGCLWSATAPATFIFSGLGPHTLYAFARNSTGKVSAAAAASTTVVGTLNFIPAAGRMDLVHDGPRNVVYITSGTSVLRYHLGTMSFLPPFFFGLGNLAGIALSPDGNTLAVADENMSGIHLVDLQSGTVMPDVTFAASFGEGGSYSVAFGGDGALLVSTRYNGSGTVPLRRIDPATGEVSVIKSQVGQDAMLSGSADGRCIAYEESNSSIGPLSIYDVASRAVTGTFPTGWFTYEVSSNRDCSQFAVPTYGGTFLFDGSLAKLGTLGVYAGAQPIGAAYSPVSDTVYFAWAGSSEVRAYDSKTLAQLAAFDLGYAFHSNGNFAYTQGRMKTSRDGSLLFATVGDGVRYQRLNYPTADDQAVATSFATPVPISLTGSGSSGAVPGFTVTAPPAHGSLQGTAPNLVYTPDPDFAGVDTFSYKTSAGAAESDVATVTITVSPGPAGAVIQAPSLKGQLSLTWSNPADADFHHVRIYRSAAAGTLGSLIADNLRSGSYTDTGLASFTTYYYTIRAVNYAGTESVSTSQLSQTTRDAVPPVTTAGQAGGVYTTPVTVGLSCSDAGGSGCAVTYYCLGSLCDPDTPYSSGITIGSSTILRYFSVDRAGNGEALHSANYLIQPRHIAVIPAALDLGAALVPYPVTGKVIVSNPDTPSFPITAALSIAGPDSSRFSVTPGGSKPCPSLTPTLNAGESCTVTVTFLPDTTGMKQAYLQILSNADTNPVLTMPLTGQGIPPLFLTTKITGNGTVNNLAQPPVFSCAAPTCIAPAAYGSSLVLRATPSTKYTFAGWTGGGCSGVDDCLLTLLADTTISAQFTALPLVKNVGKGVSYLTLADALADSTGATSFACRNVSFPEDICLQSSQAIRLYGGLTEGFATRQDYTMLQGSLVIRSGSLRVVGLKIW